MTRRKRLRKPEAKSRGKAKTTCVKLKIHGLPIAIPPELDLPAGAPFEGRDRPETMRIPEDIRELFGPLVEMATNAWRLKVRMVDPDTGEPKEEARKLYRFVEGLFRALGEAGIQVIDKTGKPYDNGMSEKVINFEQTPGLAKEEIIDTIRPSIRWKEQPLYYGEIIVGIPVIKAPPKETLGTQSASAPSEAATEPEEAPEPEEASDTSQRAAAQSEELPAPEKSESLETPKSESAASRKPLVTTRTDSKPEQAETAVSENPSGRQVQGEGVEDEPVPASRKDAQGSPVCPKTPKRSETPDQE